MKKLAIVYRSLKSLTPYANNSRTHSAKEVDEVVTSIKEFGWTNPVLLDEMGVLIAGHRRVLAAKKLKLKEVPCIILSGLSDAQRRAYRIADNRLPLNAGWDSDILSVELESLKEDDFNISVIGFGDDDLDSYLAKDDESEEQDKDEKPKKKKAKSKGKVEETDNSMHECPECGHEFECEGVEGF